MWTTKTLPEDLDETVPLPFKVTTEPGLTRLFRYTSRSSVSPSRVTYADTESPETSELDVLIKCPQISSPSTDLF